MPTIHACFGPLRSMTDFAWPPYERQFEGLRPFQTSHHAGRRVFVSRPSRSGMQAPPVDSIIHSRNRSVGGIEYSKQLGSFTAKSYSVRGTVGFSIRSRRTGPAESRSCAARALPELLNARSSSTRSDWLDSRSPHISSGRTGHTRVTKLFFSPHFSFPLKIGRAASPFTEALPSVPPDGFSRSHRTKCRNP